MTKKLDELYHAESLHEGLWGKVKSGLSKFDKYMDQKMGPIGTVKKAAPPMPPKKLTPPKEDGSLSKAAMIGIGTGVVTANPLAGLGAFSGQR